MSLKIFPVDGEGRTTTASTNLEALFLIFLFFKFRVGEIKRSQTAKCTNSLASMKARPAKEKTVVAPVSLIKHPMLLDSDDLLKALAIQAGGKIRITNDSLKTTDVVSAAVSVRYDANGCEIDLVVLGEAAEVKGVANDS